MSTLTMDMPDPDSGFLAWIAAAAAAVALAAQRIVKAFGDSRKEHSQASAQVEVINQLREELARMSTQNTRLAECLNDIQLESVRLRDEVVKLRGENAELHVTVRHLNNEVRHLRRSGARSGFGTFDERPHN